MLSVQLRIPLCCPLDTSHIHAGSRNPNSDVLSMNSRFNLNATLASSKLSATFASSNFTILDNDIYEYDKLIMADFQFDRIVQYNYLEKVGQPSVTFIVIKDDDSE